MYADRTQRHQAQSLVLVPVIQKPLSRSLHLLNETIGLQLFLGNLQGKEKRQIFQNHGSVERAPLPKDSAFLSPFSMWQVIVNY